MKKLFPIIIVTALFLLMVSHMTVAEEKKEEAKPKYIGLAACKGCHSSEKVGGTEYIQFQKDPHAKAFETLKNDESKKIAAEMGIADATKDAKCLKCHVTAYGMEDRHGPKFKYEEGVTCEACHGPGEFYYKMNIMKDHELSLKNGLIVPDAKLCMTCHNEESPTYRPFDYDIKWKLIEHGKKKEEKK